MEILRSTTRRAFSGFGWECLFQRLSDDMMVSIVCAWVRVRVCPLWAVRRGVPFSEKIAFSNKEPRPDFLGVVHVCEQVVSASAIVTTTDGS
jgi:hypothetical protein